MPSSGPPALGSVGLAHTPDFWLQRRACLISSSATPSLELTVQDTVRAPSPGSTRTLAGSGLTPASAGSGLAALATVTWNWKPARLPSPVLGGDRHGRRALGHAGKGQRGTAGCHGYGGNGLIRRGCCDGEGVAVGVAEHAGQGHVLRITRLQAGHVGNGGGDRWRGLDRYGEGLRDRAAVAVIGGDRDGGSTPEPGGHRQAGPVGGYRRRGGGLFRRGGGDGQVVAVGVAEHPGQGDPHGSRCH